MSSGGDGDGGGMGGIQSMGIINALKTGDMHMDLVIAMCIPIMMRLIFKGVENFGNSVSDTNTWKVWFAKQMGYKERFLVSKTVVDTARYRSYDTVVSLDGDTQNTVLIKAIELYINTKCNIKFDNANIDLTSTEQKKGGGGGGGNHDDDSNNDGDIDRTVAGRLSKYKLVKKPIENEWFDLGRFGSNKNEAPKMVQLIIRKSEDTVGGKDNAKQRETKTYHFRSLGSTSIDDFLQTSYDWYIEELRKLEDNSRHLYELQSKKSSSSSDGEGNNGSFEYKRYKLSDEKTFDSLFFKEKETVLRIMKHFTEKTGKYGVKGYPHKLGLLLHGPPGTGKTSLIKALANHTGRSIVNVPLAKINTNTELMSVFFDQSYKVSGQCVPIKLGFKDVIFVLEDVDAQSKVVKRRDGKKTSEVVQTEQIELPPAKTLWRLLLESNDEDCKELVNTLVEKSERLKKEACSADLVTALADRVHNLQGLSLVGALDPNLATIGEETLESADRITEAQQKLDQFLSSQVKPLKALIERGGEINDEVVNTLLSVPGGEIGEPRYADIEIPQPSGPDSRQHSRDSAAPAAPPTPMELAIAASLMDTGGAGGVATGPAMPSNQAGGTTTKPDGKSSWVGSGAFASIGKDKLNLTGLLNVLDGVVDSPGRLLIMTTNHPEMLDPALIRPGRIDKKLLLGFMRPVDVICMIEHYFQTDLDDAQKDRVRRAMSGNIETNHPKVNMTPAQVEQLAAEHDEVEDMIKALEEKGAPFTTATMSGGIPRPTGGARASSVTVAFDV